MKKLISLLLAFAMLLSLAACGGGGSSDSGTTSGDDSKTSGTSGTGGEVSGDVDNGDGTYYNSELGYTYGATFYSDEPVSYTTYIQDNAAYPWQESWDGELGIFTAITNATNVTLDHEVIDWGDYSTKVSLALSTNAPYIIPKIYDENSYVDGGGVVAISDYVQYMPNYSAMVEEYNLEADLETITQENGKYYRLPGLKETCLQDYTLVIRKDLFDAAGVDVVSDENDWTWDEFVDDLIKVKAYMVSQGIVGENDYIWSDMWCGETGSGQGGNLLKLIGASYGIYSGWAITTNYGLVYDADSDSFVDGSVSEEYKEMMTIVQKLLDNKILDPETFTQQDDVANNKFYRGETALISTNRSQYTAQEEGIKGQLGEGNYELYRVVLPVGNCNYQSENSRLECGVMISSQALEELGEAEFIKMLRFVDWLWYSDAGLTLTKWGVEGETYTVTDGVYSLTDGYYCGGLSIAQTSDDQVDMRIEYGYACGNFMYSGSLELLTSNFDEGLRDFYNRMDEYRELRPLDPTVTFDEDTKEMLGIYGTTLMDTVNTWTLYFAMGQKDIEDDWNEYVATVEAANLQNVLDYYNTNYKG